MSPELYDFVNGFRLTPRDSDPGFIVRYWDSRSINLPEDLFDLSDQAQLHTALHELGHSIQYEVGFVRHLLEQRPPEGIDMDTYTAMVKNVDASDLFDSLLLPLDPGHIGYDRSKYINYSISEFDMETASYRILAEHLQRKNIKVDPDVQNGYVEYMETWSENLFEKAEVELHELSPHIEIANRWRSHDFFRGRLLTMEDIYERY